MCSLTTDKHSDNDTDNDNDNDTDKDKDIKEHAVSPALQARSCMARYPAAF